MWQIVNSLLSTTQSQFNCYFHMSTCCNASVVAACDAVAQAPINYALVIIMSTTSAASAAVIILLMCVICVKGRHRTGQ